MDAVYILGTGSKYNNLELLYSLRSLERYGEGIDKVILIGEKPSFLNYKIVQHYPFRESGNKDFRIASKIFYACQSKIVQGEFFFLNDDFFFTQPFHVVRYPYFQRGQLLEGEPQSEYQKILARTRDYLLAKGKPTIHFDVHTPIVYDSEVFLALQDCWEYSRDNGGIVVKSTYCNMLGLDGQMYQDVKLKSLITPGEKLAIQKSGCFTINDASWNNDNAWTLGVYDYLQREFPNKSKYEL